MGSDESHFNVSLIVRDKVTRPCPETTIFEEKGEPDRIRTVVPLLTGLTPYREAKPALMCGCALNLCFSIDVCLRICHLFGLVWVKSVEYSVLLLLFVCLFVFQAKSTSRQPHIVTDLRTKERI